MVKESQGTNPGSKPEKLSRTKKIEPALSEYIERVRAFGKRYIKDPRSPIIPPDDVVAIVSFLEEQGMCLWDVIEDDLADRDVVVGCLTVRLREINYGRLPQGNYWNFYPDRVQRFLESAKTLLNHEDPWVRETTLRLLPGNLKDHPYAEEFRAFLPGAKKHWRIPLHRSGTRPFVPFSSLESSGNLRF